MRRRRPFAEWGEHGKEAGGQMQGKRAERVEESFQRLAPFIQQHSLMVGRYADTLARYILQTQGEGLFQGLPTELFLYMNLMGKYHDVGKSAIAEEIWQHAGPLGQPEWKLVRAHPLFGAYLIRGSLLAPEWEGSQPDIWEAIAQCCQYHHERWDGGGYPFGLVGRQIPLPARMVGIADAYDAMTADRPYRRRMDGAAALEEIRRGAGRQFDPELVELFCRALEKWPIGSRLSPATSHNGTE